uniref:NADH dehydrogenase subunit 3 n=1 Tax=Batracomorphus nigromarginattus TaxID=1962548 RepID=UPI00257DAC7C|nr:NADH dehydrogenase subunit 3 [Batracomorphus nigromarginattus]WHE42670.1 NADH dehydrogenase subunit 3 [Batracomorphus nigromarginattus]
MMLIMLFCMMMILFLMILVMIILFIFKKKKNNLNKMSPFECGFNSMTSKRIPFSIHFFSICMLFLIFDIEVIIIMPLIMSMKFSMMKYWMMTSISLIIILIMGLYHEWKNGMLKWTK